MNLTEEQEKAKDEIMMWFHTGLINYSKTSNELENDTFTNFWFLVADAGCGKSFLVAKILADLRVAALVAAPSHRAKRICRNFLNDNGLFHIESTTIHSALSLRLIKKGEGKQELSFKEKKEDPLIGIKLLVCDEISMYDDKICESLRYAQQKYNFKVLLVGDLKQLPPINLMKFPVMDFVSQNNGIENTSKLTQVMRYSDKEIAEACEAAKVSVIHKISFNADVFIPDNPNFKRINDHQFIVDKFFRREDAIILAYKNKTVDFWNKTIRQNLFSDCYDIVPEYIEGEIIICNKPVWSSFNSGGMSAYVTGTELKILEIRRETIIFYDLPIERWLLTVTDGQFKTTISRICEEYQPHFNQSSKNSHFSKLKKAYFEDKTLNKSEKEKIADLIWNWLPVLNSDLGYPFCCTIHKSQGSSFDTVFVVDDIKIKDRRKEALESFEWTQPRLWYVALSRAKNSLFIINE